ncbi:MAG TPA: hypothetical protein VN829_10445 [Dongiaceae bacterium]|nr:hypothetical protein [Dongiaceae bacterium]
MISSRTPSSIWVERYEALRHHVLNAGPVLDLQPLGLVLWLAQGMAGWMCQWTEAVEMGPSSAPVPSPPPHPAGSLWQQQLTRLLAQITVQRLYPTVN